jgi:hypothetical protein
VYGRWNTEVDRFWIQWLLLTITANIGSYNEWLVITKNPKSLVPMSIEVLVTWCWSVIGNQVQSDVVNIGKLIPKIIHYNIINRHFPELRGSCQQWPLALYSVTEERYCWEWRSARLPDFYASTRLIVGKISTYQRKENIHLNTYAEACNLWALAEIILSGHK